ncbi:MAG: tetratricopeptide repeat protein [Lachnospiraceae bacterium]|nr:tetratricopeptide repeat protein [Lachnospiraceae bacterium]MBP5184346.1 tetratricopeptide repeat protein [Lachnospiraceae bacterium]
MANLNYEKIDSISTHYYNLGLECAKVRNLTGAIEYLKRSLEADKRNTEARNLLGLCYYECGEIVEALSAWVVSKHFSPEKNLADYYLEEVQGNPVALDSMDQAVAKYNRALEDARNGKNDMAVIQLKRAVSMHPNFIRAILLLALLAMMDNDSDRALKLVNRVLSIDCANTVALRYKAEIEGAVATGKAMNQSARDIVQESFSSSKLEAEVVKEEELDDGPNMMAFISLIAGILIGVAVVFFLVVPSREQRIRDDYLAKEKNYSENLNIKITRINSLENDVVQLQLQKTELEELLREAKEELETVHFDAPEQAQAFKDLFAATEAYIDFAVNKQIQAANNRLPDEALKNKALEALQAVDLEQIPDAGAKTLYNTMLTEIQGGQEQEQE